jgi:hypothetical protein
MAHVAALVEMIRARPIGQRHAGAIALTALADALLYLDDDYRHDISVALKDAALAALVPVERAPKTAPNQLDLEPRKG